MEKTNEQVAEETNEHGLPTKVEIPFDDIDSEYFEYEVGEDVADEFIAEYLSDKYGYLNRSFKYEEDEDRKVIIVSEIDWEIDEEEDVVDYDEAADTIFDDMYSEVDVHTPNK